MFSFRETTPLRKLLMLKAMTGSESLVEATATPGNPCTFETDVAKALRKLIVPFADENGITGMKVFHTGKNLFDVSSVVSGSLDGYGNLVSNPNRRTSGFIMLKAGKYTVSRKAEVDWWKAWLYTLNEEPVAGLFNNNQLSYTITLASDCKIRISFDYIVTAENEVQLESGSTASTYETYSGNTYPVAWTDSATAGSFNALTGELTITSPESKTVALEPISVTALVGDNVLWSDANGNLEVKYMKKG